MTRNRNSSIECVKLLGIFIIIISHVIITLTGITELETGISDINVATRDVKTLLFSMLQYSGHIGNVIFFVCSAWFLVQSRTYDKKKILHMILDVWIISMLILVVVLIFRKGDIQYEWIPASIFPVTFAANWYVTCYLLFYSIHLYLNWIIERMSQKTLLRTTVVMQILYVGINFFQGGHFFINPLLIWISIYFLVAYMELYLVDFSNHRKANWGLFLVGVFGTFGLVLLTNSLGLRFSAFENQLLHWNTMGNPFIICVAIGLLNLFKSVIFENKIINDISKMSLYIYVIHENVILKYLYRPLLWKDIIEKYGVNHLLLWTFILSVFIFVFSLVMSMIYRSMFGRLVDELCDRIYILLKKVYLQFETIVMKLK